MEEPANALANLGADLRESGIVSGDDHLREIGKGFLPQRAGQLRFEADDGIEEGSSLKGQRSIAGSVGAQVQESAVPLILSGEGTQAHAEVGGPVGEVLPGRFWMGEERAALEVVFCRVETTDEDEGETPVGVIHRVDCSRFEVQEVVGSCGPRPEVTTEAPLHCFRQAAQHELDAHFGKDAFVFLITGTEEVEFINYGPAEHPLLTHNQVQGFADGRLSDAVRADQKRMAIEDDSAFSDTPVVLQAKTLDFQRTPVPPNSDEL